MRGAGFPAALALASVAACSTAPPRGQPVGLEVREAAAPRPAKGELVPVPRLAGATRVAALRVGGEARVAAAGLGWLSVFSADGTLVGEAQGQGVAQVLEAIDVDGDGQVEIVIGRGMGRDALDAPPSVTVLDAAAPGAGGASIPLPPTARAEVVAVAADPAHPGTLWVAAYESKYFVDVLHAERGADGAWTARPYDRIRVATDLAAGDLDGNGTADLVVARPYGEELDAPGDVFLLGAPGRRQLLPSTRGARAVVLVPATESRSATVVYADGWHRDYGRQAEALLTAASWVGGAWRRRGLAHVEGRHGYDRLRVGDLDGDGRREVVAAGDGPAIAVTVEGDGDSEVTALGDGEAWDVAPIDLEGDGDDEVVIAGTTPGIWRTTKAGR